MSDLLTTPLAKLTGILERITYHNDENGYTVARLAVEGMRDLVTVVGNFSNPAVGEQLLCEGSWISHREFGRQFSVERYSTSKPATVFAIEKYLGSGLIRGVGPVMARRMVEIFGLDTLDIIEQDPEKLLRVQGIGRQRVNGIKKAWHDQREIRNVMLYLQEKGVSALYAVKIYKNYGDESLKVVEENPYRLAQDIWGIGFKTADKIAQQIGVLPDSRLRLRAGLLHTLSEATNHGHVCLPQSKLLASASEILGCSEETISPYLQEMASENEIIAEILPNSRSLNQEPDYYHPALYFTEVGLAAQIRKRMALQPLKPVNETKFNAWLASQELTTGFSLSEEQKHAVLLALSNRFLVLTGGPGTGKTSVTNLIAKAFEARRMRIVLVSPTGRAARRLSEVTGREALTIHRALKWDPQARKFQHDEENPLECDVLIADEVSMLDEVLANQLMKATPVHAHVLFIGDSDQLPSVGAGSVLGDLLASGVVPSVRLTQVFRQAQKSLIVTSAHRIRNGDMPHLVKPSNRGDSNLIWVEIEESEEGIAQVLKLARRTLPALGYSREDIQILTPMHRGSLGVGYLNEQLQEALNPPQPECVEFMRGSHRYREKDRVIQLVNNYDKLVFNGDIGVIEKISRTDQLMHVRFSDTLVEYDFADCDELQLAYALSIHKSQGSEYRAVILVLHSSQFMMLQRNLLYTGLTRARDICILVGDMRAIGRAVKNNKTVRRHTHLAERLVNSAVPA